MVTVFKWPHIYVKQGGMFKSHCHADVQGAKSTFIFSVTNLVCLLSPK